MHVTLPALLNSFFGKDMVYLLFFLQLFSSIDLKVLQTSEHHTKAVKTSSPASKLNSARNQISLCHGACPRAEFH